jgi:hypothetical protein
MPSAKLKKQSSSVKKEKQVAAVVVAAPVKKGKGKRKLLADPVDTVKQAKWLLSTNLLLEALKKQNEDVRNLVTALNQKKKGIIASLKAKNFHGQFEDIGSVETTKKNTSVTELPTQLLLQALRSGKEINDDLLRDLTRQHEENVTTEVKVKFFKPRALPTLSHDVKDITAKIKKQIKACPYYPPVPQKPKKLKIAPVVPPPPEADEEGEEEDDEEDEEAREEDEEEKGEDEENNNGEEEEAEGDEEMKAQEELEVVTAAIVLVKTDSGYQVKGKDAVENNQAGNEEDAEETEDDEDVEEEEEDQEENNNNNNKAQIEEIVENANENPEPSEVAEEEPTASVSTPFFATLVPSASKGRGRPKKSTV